MMRFRHAIVACALLASIPPAQAAMLDSYNLEGWTIGAYSNDQSGQFGHCAASVPYRSGILLLFSVGRTYKWSMGLFNPRWKLTRGAEYNVIYAVDNGPRLSGSAVARFAEAVQITLLDSRSLFESFQRGRLLTVFAAGETFRFSLANSSKALSATLECIRRHIAPPTTARNPFAPKQATSTPSRAAEVNAESRAEAAVVVSNVLSAAQINGFRLATHDEIPDAFKTFDSVWVADGIAGAIRIVGSEVGLNADDILTGIMASDAKACKGAFASGKLPGKADASAMRLMTGCEMGTGTERFHYTVTARPKGGFYTFVVLGKAPSRQGSTMREAGCLKPPLNLSRGNSSSGESPLRSQGMAIT